MMGLITPPTDAVAVPMQQREYADNNCDENDTNQSETLLAKPNGYQGRPPPIDIEFVDLTYTVPIGRNGQ